MLRIWVLAGSLGTLRLAGLVQALAPAGDETLAARFVVCCLAAVAHVLFCASFGEYK